MSNAVGQETLTIDVNLAIIIRLLKHSPKEEETNLVSQFLPQERY